LIHSKGDFWLKKRISGTGNEIIFKIILKTVEFQLTKREANDLGKTIGSNDSMPKFSNYFE
jgi:hypothetical protein